MAETSPNVATLSLTAALIERVGEVRFSSAPPEALTVAKQCLLDWLGVMVAGSGEPLARILVDEFAGRSAADGLPLPGRERRARMDDWALIVGAMGHALDFDDVIMPMGHPTAPVAPAVLALAARTGASGAATLEAFIAGVETECRVARLLGPSHYAKGWHTTATAGTFGAAAAACRLLGLDDEATARAFGLAGTQAAGLKSGFGTMAKPLHAGKAAQNGLFAARLAARGFTADPDILASAQGFADTQSAAPDPAAALAERDKPWVVEALFKYHAACYLTHDSIEAATALRREAQISADDVAAVTVKVPPGHLGVCAIPEPATGLQCKFSLRMTTALALAGEDTSDERLFSDETARRADLVALRDKVTLDPTQSGRGCAVEATLTDGRRVSSTGDVSQPLRDLALQQEKLERKFRNLVGPVAGEAKAERLVAFCRAFEAQPGVGALIALCGPA